MSILQPLDWAAIRSHYDGRINARRNALAFRTSNSPDRFAQACLGIADPAANYSAAEHFLGPKVLGSNPNAERRVFDLATKFIELKNARSVPDLIRNAQLKYLQISVGSEISCLMNPEVCWVANTRTIWTHLVIKHADDIGRADEELKLYREADVDSEMAYAYWSAIHAELGVALTRVAEIGAVLARNAGVEPGNISYLWADAIASFFYGRHHGE